MVELLQLAIGALLTILFGLAVSRILRRSGVIPLLWTLFWAMGGLAIFALTQHEALLAAVLAIAALIALIGASVLEFLRRAEKE